MPLPPPEPAAVIPLPEDENLFNSGVRAKARRRFAVGVSEAMERSSEGSVRPAAHTMPVGRNAVPPVLFDPAVETRSLRERP